MIIIDLMRDGVAIFMCEPRYSYSFDAKQGDVVSGESFLQKQHNTESLARVSCDQY